jgi:uncharacterized membrane protein YhiD involved in acid resistance
MNVAGLEDYALRMLAALLLGSLIGAERQFRQRLAGLRTNALVSVGSALFVATRNVDPLCHPERSA